MISEYLQNKGLYMVEGNVGDNNLQKQDINKLLENKKIVMEIGFNGGHSAENFLENNKDLVLVSFDLGVYNYVLPAKEYIDNKYPNRHLLILGDSRITVPNFIKSNPELKFDLIFIDGGHDYEVAKEDLENCRNLSHKDTIVILDDTIYTEGWEKHYTIGPTKVWLEALEQNKIEELGRIDYSVGRGMSWGKYIITKYF